MQGTRKSAHEGSGPYRPDIDGLRAIAVLLVVVFHFHLTSESKSGFIGVDIFFVISGFLITRIIRDQVQAGSFSLATFWTRRLRRLAPALFVVLVLLTAYGAARMLQDDFVRLMREVLAAQFYYANIYFWQKINYFDLQVGDIYLLHTWSLALEEQFYIVYPLALLATLRYGRRYAPHIVVAAALVSFALNLAFVDVKAEATFYLMPTRAWELLLGALITWLPSVNRAWLSNLLGVSGAALIAVAIASFDEGTRFPGTFALLPTLGAVCLICAGGQRDSLAMRALSIAPLVYVGRLSYSLYLVHWPVNVIAGNEMGEGYTLGWRAAMVVLCLVLSALLYHAVENPFRHGRLLPRRRAFVATYGAGLVASLALSAIVFTTHGLPARLSPQAVRLAEFANDVPRKGCKEFARTAGAGHQDDLCLLGTPERSPEWLIYGDSHTWAAQDALDLWLRNTGSAGRLAFLNTCPPIKDVYVLRRGTACHALNEQMLALAASDSRIRRVLLVSSWRQAVEGNLSSAPDVKLPLEESKALFDRQFAATLRALRTLGKEVYVWEPLPGARDNVPRRLALAAQHGAAAELDVSKAAYLSDHAFFFTTMARHQALLTGTFSPAAVLCQTGTCASVVSGSPVYFDANHLASSGSGFWAAALAAQLGPRERSPKDAP